MTYFFVGHSLTYFLSDIQRDNHVRTQNFSEDEDPGYAQINQPETSCGKQRVNFLLKSLFCLSLNNRYIAQETVAKVQRHDQSLPVSVYVQEFYL